MKNSKHITLWNIHLKALSRKTLITFCVILFSSILLSGSFCFGQNDIQLTKQDDANTTSKSAIQECRETLQIQKNNQELDKCKKGEVCGYGTYQIFAYICIAVTLALLILSAFLLKKIKNKNNDIAYYIARKEHYKSEFYKNKDVFYSEKNSFIAEIEKQKKDNKRLLAEINQLQQDQYSYERQRAHPSQPAEPQPQSLYADAIIDGKFNSVKECPDDNTIFELKLNKAGDTRAIVIIYKEAEQLVIKRPEFLDGCEKQILGNTTITMLHEGVALKESSGKWIISAIPEVKIS